MARNAFKWIAVALVAASLLLVAAIALARLRPTPTQITLTQVPLESIAVPLDANGAGMQFLDDAVLSVKLEPFPLQPDADSSLTLVALDRRTRAILTITPTLTVSEMTQVDGADFPLARDAGGAYVATGRFFPNSGQWRMRVRIDFGAGEPYSMLIVADAR